ncbi:MAG: pyridoxamine 5'-phosphate oxidase family protein [Bacteroidota bacterium]
MAELPEKRITEFIHKHHIFTLATSAANIPYVSTCFYVYMDELNLFVFTSDFGTRHVDELLAQPSVAGAIALETTMIGKIQGIQFTGLSAELKDELYTKACSAYLKKFPVAGFKKLVLWGIKPDFIKMTHNRLGFGTKLTWKQER